MKTDVVELNSWLTEQIKTLMKKSYEEGHFDALNGIHGTDHIDKLEVIIDLKLDVK